MSEIWMVRAGRGACNLDRFLDQSLILIGCANVSGPNLLKASREELYDHTRAGNPSWITQKAAIQAGQIFRFLQEMQEDDEVITYDPSLRRYLLGKVVGPGACTDDNLYFRKVSWSRRVSRDHLSVETRNSLGAIMTIFRLSEVASDELRHFAVDLASSSTAAWSSRGCTGVVSSTQPPVASP